MLTALQYGILGLSAIILYLVARTQFRGVWSYVFMAFSLVVLGLGGYLDSARMDRACVIEAFGKLDPAVQATNAINGIMSAIIKDNSAGKPADVAQNLPHIPDQATKITDAITAARNHLLTNCK